MESHDWTQAHKYKTEYLPIQRTPFGFEQKTNYHQPDLFHEQVVEVDSPFVTIFPAETQVTLYMVIEYIPILDCLASNHSLSFILSLFCIQGIHLLAVGRPKCWKINLPPQFYLPIRSQLPGDYLPAPNTQFLLYKYSILLSKRR